MAVAWAQTPTHRTAPHRTGRIPTHSCTPHTHSVVFSVSSAPFPPIRFLVRGLRHLTITLVHPHRSTSDGVPTLAAQLSVDTGAKLKSWFRPPATHSIQNPLASFPISPISRSRSHHDQPSIVLKPSTIHPKCFNFISRQHCARALSRSTSIPIAYILFNA